jgi:hypothetical protein
MVDSTQERVAAEGKSISITGGANRSRVWRRHDCRGDSTECRLTQQAAKVKPKKQLMGQEGFKDPFPARFATVRS